MCRCKHASATGVPVGRVPVVVFIARGGARRDVGDARVRLGRVPQPHAEGLHMPDDRNVS